jgi:hypothetical protein
MSFVAGLSDFNPDIHHRVYEASLATFVTASPVLVRLASLQNVPNQRGRKCGFRAYVNRSWIDLRSPLTIAILTVDGHM